jgi:hypothetical protein
LVFVRFKGIKLPDFPKAFFISVLYNFFMPSNAAFFFNRMTIALMSATAASILIGNVVQTNSNILTLGHMALAQTQPYSSAHSHVAGLFYYPQDPFHALFPIRNIEMSKFLDKAGDAMSRSGSFAQPYLQSLSTAMTPDGNCEMCQFIKYTPGPIGKAGVAYTPVQTLDLTGAKRIVFFAKGELGGENIAFVAIGKPSNTQPVSPNIFTKLNFAVISKNVTLTNDWRRYQLSLNGIDFKGVTDQFGFIVSKVRTQSQGPNSNTLYPLDDANANHIVFFLKGVTIDNMPAMNPLPTVQLSSTNTTTTS